MGVKNEWWHPLYLALEVALVLIAGGGVAFRRGYAAGRRTAAILLIAVAVAYVATIRAGDAVQFMVLIVVETAVLLFSLWVFGRESAPREAAGSRDGATHPGAGNVTAGFALSLAAGAVQAANTPTVTVIWPFDHNGLFHLVQLVGLAVLIRGLGALLRPPA
jgi:hypothetical protein